MLDTVWQRNSISWAIYGKQGYQTTEFTSVAYPLVPFLKINNNTHISTKLQKYNQKYEIILICVEIMQKIRMISGQKDQYFKLHPRMWKGIWS